MSEMPKTRSIRSTESNLNELTSEERSRRRFLTSTTAVVGLVGASVATWPFLASWKPSARAKLVGGPILIDVDDIEPGAQVMVTWQGKPVWILRRTPEMLEKLTNQRLLDELADPDSEVTTQQPSYAQDLYRSIKPEILVVIALCTHLGCIPLFRPGALAEGQENEWMGGYFCPCHKSKFDLAGRVYKSVPAPTNLIVPPYQYLDENLLVIGTHDSKKEI